MNHWKVLLAPYPRTVAEIFAPEDLERLSSFCELIWARDDRFPQDELERHLPEVWAYVGMDQELRADQLKRADKLKTIIEVGGSFPPGIDYDSCFSNGIRVLSCAPAFGPQVAEMALAMALAGGRGLVAGHEAFRQGVEEWQGDRTARDFTLFRQKVGFVGFGSLARNLLPLLSPFECQVSVYDPWLPESMIRDAGCAPTDLESLLGACRVLFILAVPTPENRGLLSRERLSLLPRHALLVLLSRAHLVDFDALTEAVMAGRLQAAMDVFPQEPLPLEHPIRTAPDAILSAHRGASIRRERQAIGRMVVDDLELLSRGLPPLRLQSAQPELIKKRLRE
jgi:phosphoglycerate dehydrogenase-like enzyme